MGTEDGFMCPLPRCPVGGTFFRGFRGTFLGFMHRTAEAVARLNSPVVCENHFWRIIKSGSGSGKLSKAPCDFEPDPDPDSDSCQKHFSHTGDRTGVIFSWNRERTAVSSTDKPRWRRILAGTWTNQS